MVYKKTPPNPLSGQRLRELLKEKGYTHEAFAEIIDVTPDYVGHMCQGKRAISPKRAKEFGDLLGVRPEYLLGVDDFRTHDLNWLKHSVKGVMKKQEFLEKCLEYWDYKILETNPIYEPDGDAATDDQETTGVIPMTVIGLIYTIRKPNGEIVKITEKEFNQLGDDLVRSTHRLFRETFDPEY